LSVLLGTPDMIAVFLGGSCNDRPFILGM